MKNENTGFTFKLQRSDGFSVEIRLSNEHQGLGELMETFGDFLKGCGFTYSGSLEIINDDDGGSMEKSELIKHLQAELAEVLKGPSTPNLSQEKFLLQRANDIFDMLSGFGVLTDVKDDQER